MFKTPALQEFWLTWYLQPSQLPFPLNNEEFLSERLIEDVCDGKSSVAMVILEVKMPDDEAMRNHKVGQDIAVQFKILCSKDTAQDLRDIGYKVQDRDEPDEDDAISWTELLAIVNGHMRPLGPELDKPVRATDDNDPNAPWFNVVGIKRDDDGWFIAIEEVEV